MTFWGRGVYVWELGSFAPLLNPPMDTVQHILCSSFFLPLLCFRFCSVVLMTAMTFRYSKPRALLLMCKQHLLHFFLSFQRWPWFIKHQHPYTRSTYAFSHEYMVIFLWQTLCFFPIFLKNLSANGYLFFFSRESACVRIFLIYEYNREFLTYFFTEEKRRGKRDSFVCPCPKHGETLVNNGANKHRLSTLMECYRRWWVLRFGRAKSAKCVFLSASVIWSDIGSVFPDGKKRRKKFHLN